MTYRTKINKNKMNKINKIFIISKAMFTLAFLLITAGSSLSPLLAGRVKFIGDQENFFVKRFDRLDTTRTSTHFEKRVCTLKKKGTNCFVFLDDSLKVDDEKLNETMIKWDRDLYPRITEMFGNPMLPGIDGYDEIFIVLTTINDKYDGVENFNLITTYYDYDNQLIQGVNEYSCQREVIFIDPSKVEAGTDSFMRELSKSLQKHIRWYNKVWIKHNDASIQDERDDRISDSDYWVNEGLSELAGYIAGYGHSPAWEFFQAYPDTTLGQTYPDYYYETSRGAGYLFFLYLFEQFGPDIITQIEQNDTTGITSITDAIKTLRITRSIESIFNDWIVANYIDNISISNGVYGYNSLNISAKPTAEINTFPKEEQELTIYQQEVDYIHISSGDAGSVRFVFNGESGNNFQMMSIKLSSLKDPVVETVSLTANNGQKLFDRIGFDYDSVVMVITNLAEYGYGKATYSVYKGGPKISAFSNPALNENIIINVLSQEDATISVLQQGMDDEILLDATPRKEIYVREQADTGIASLCETSFLEDSSKNWETNEFSNGFLKITSGKGAGQEREIMSNGRTRIILKQGFTDIPDNTSKYEVIKLVKIEALYTASYYIDKNYPGIGKIIVRGRGADGVEGASIYKFNVIPIYSDEDAVIRINYLNVVEQQAALSAAKALGKKTAGCVTLLTGETEALSGGYMAGNIFSASCSATLKSSSQNILFEKSMELSEFDKKDMENLIEKCSIYKKIENQWTYLKSESKTKSQKNLVISFSDKIDTIATGTTSYATIVDNQPPSIIQKENAFFDDEINITINDQLSGFDESTLDDQITFYMGCTPVNHTIQSYTDKSVNILIKNSDIVEAMEQSGSTFNGANLKITALDRSYNRSEKSVALTSMPINASLICWPSPAVQNMNLTLSVSNSALIAGSECSIKIYDFSGTLIFSIDSDDIVFTGNTAVVRWNLNDSDNSPVPNGIYIVKAEIKNNSANEKIYKKTAVLR